MATLFVLVFVCAKIAFQPINSIDYDNTEAGLQALLHGQNPYVEAGVEYYMPPWSAAFLMPLVNQSLTTWLALTIALFVAINVDLGGPPAILLLAHPAFLMLLATSNQEWLLIGPGLWLLYRAKHGWLRGLAWLLMACKPQTTFFILLFDAWDALRARDWKAFTLSISVAVLSIALFPQFLSRLVAARWTASILPTYGLLAAIGVTLLIFALRRTRLSDRKTLGLMLAPIWSPYMLEYSHVAVAFTLRGAAWWRILLYVVGSIALAAIFWQTLHTTEAAGLLGMTLLAALLAPAYREPATVDKQLDITPHASDAALSSA